MFLKSSELNRDENMNMVKKIWNFFSSTRYHVIEEIMDQDKEIDRVVHRLEVFKEKLRDIKQEIHPLEAILDDMKRKDKRKRNRN